tara:strand:+ start:992 stop:1189 length:198 start_codon:yes stop_codon:yes gene_type:complete
MKNLNYFGTKYQMIQQRLASESYVADRKPFVQMVVEKYTATRYDQKFFVYGFLIGVTPYVVHMKF